MRIITAFLSILLFVCLSFQNAFAGGEWPFPFKSATFPADEAGGCYEIEGVRYTLCLTSIGKSHVLFQADLVEGSLVVGSGHLSLRRSADGQQDRLVGRLEMADGGTWMLSVAYLLVPEEDRQFWASLDPQTAGQQAPAPGALSRR